MHAFIGLSEDVMERCGNGHEGEEYDSCDVEVHNCVDK